jgi:hypothetical protein
MHHLQQTLQRLSLTLHIIVLKTAFYHIYIDKLKTVAHFVKYFITREHVAREGDSVADFLAKESLGRDDAFIACCKF